jgi:mercuric ion transport protein
VNRPERVAVVGAAAVCGACCAGPILRLLAAIGLGTALGLATLGLLGLVVAAVGVVGVFMVRRRRRARACSTTARTVLVPAPTIRASR